MAVLAKKMKTLRVMEILLNKTDENNMLSAAGIIEILENQYGISADRKSIYSDIELLRDFGIDIVQQKGINPGYYVGSRKFELPELKLLVDAVQSSKFITAKKSEELINKLKTLTNEACAKGLQRQVYIHNRIKTENETIFYSVDSIHNAIFHNRQIRFKYMEWNVNGQLQYKRNGEYYVISPWALTWDDENYYLVSYEEASNMIKYFRVDKMRQIEMTDDLRQGAELFKTFDLGDFAKKTFGMFEGADERVSFICSNHLIGVMIDRFGKDIRIMKADDEHVQFSTIVALSPQFFGWLSGLGNKIYIKSPESVKHQYYDYLRSLLENENAI